MIFLGYKYVNSADGKLVHSVEWCSVPVVYPFQTILKDIKVAPVARPKLYKTIEEAFPIGDTVFVIMGPCYGSKAEVIRQNLYCEQPDCQSYKSYFLCCSVYYNRFF